jgi:hypothetical protein
MTTNQSTLEIKSRRAGGMSAALTAALTRDSQ